MTAGSGPGRAGPLPLVPVGIAVDGLPPALQAAAEHSVPAAIPGASVATNLSPTAPESWWVVTLPPFPAEAAAIDLGPALRLLNFDGSVLLPGTLTIFQRVQEKAQQSILQALPLGLQPVVVQYNVAALHAAGVAAPRPGWTLADFENTCGALAGALAAGRLDDLNIRAVLYPQRTLGFSDSTGAEVTMASDSVLWEAFITGFGGTVLHGTTVDWASGPALTGLQKMMDIFQRYGAADPFVPNTNRGTGPGLEHSTALAALQFRIPYQLLPPSAGALQVPGFAPFPRLPVHSVTPAVPVGCELLYHTPSGLAGSPPASLAQDAMSAAVTTVRFAEWTYADGQQALIGGGGIAPITLAAAAASAFWQAYGVGGSSNDVLLGEDWTGAEGALTTGLPAVLSDVRRDPTGLQASLRGLSQTLSNALTTDGK